MIEKLSANHRVLEHNGLAQRGGHFELLYQHQCCLDRDVALGIIDSR